MNFSLGALKDKEDLRDFKAEPILAAAAPVDWDYGAGLIEPFDENQDGSSSCTAQAWSYYFWQLTRNDYTRRDLYARIFVPPVGGAYIRDGGLKLVNEGITTRNEVADPVPQTETEMRTTTGTPQQRASDLALNSFLIDTQNIDTVAAAIRDYKGVVFGLYLKSDYSLDPDNLEPPATVTNLGHALYLFDYHLHNGVKCTIAKSSWCGLINTPNGQERHHIHHIKENYYSSGMTFNPWTLIPKENQIMIEFVKNESKPGEYGLLVTSSVGTQYIPASNEVDLKARFPQVPLKPNGSVDFALARKISL